MAVNAETLAHNARGDAPAEPFSDRGDDTAGIEHDVTVVVLAGGASRRFGGPGDDKLDARLEGRPVLDVTLSHVPRGWPVIVVGPRRTGARSAPTDGARNDAAGDSAVAWVQDDPPLGGPVAAIAAALPHVRTPVCAVLAGDTPFGGLTLPGLAQAIGDRDGAQLVADGRIQPLLAVYRTDSLRTAVERLPEPSGASMRALLAPLDLAVLDLSTALGGHGEQSRGGVRSPDGSGAATTPLTRAVARDVDTVDDLAWLRDHGIA